MSGELSALMGAAAVAVAVAGLQFALPCGCMSTGATQAQRRAEARIGHALQGKWRLDSVLGIGGLAVVYAATHRDGQRVAIKILHPELSTYEEIRSRFLREAQVANQVRHPGVVSITDEDVTEDGEAFLVMDLLDGETMDARRKKAGGTIAPAEVLSIAEQALDVLVAAHDKGIIHRDLKPENLFLTREGRVMVLDFWMARLHDVSSGDPVTQAGMAMGTPAYMPPEQARGRWDLVDARSDLWALGATMFTLLAGRTVHTAVTMSEALTAAITRPAPPLRSVAASVPAAAASVVDRALAFEPNDRWPDARAMMQAVRDAAAMIGEE